MDHFKRFLFCLLLLSSSDSWAQDCKCLSMNIIKGEPGSEDQDQVRVRIKNSCIVRRWFYTPAFWIRIVEDDGTTAKTSVLHKLHTDQPEFILFRWKEEKVLTFKPGMSIKDKQFEISYENTDHVYPSRLFGSKTYLCSGEMSNKEQETAK